MRESPIIAGIAAPLPVNNLDTDQIMPKQFLLGIDKSGLARGLLFDLRFDASGQIRESFVLNQAAYQGARILLAGSNFGCGSSREHAVWGMQQAGFEAVIAPSYGEIFYFNAANNRLLLVTLAPEQIEDLVKEVESGSDKNLIIDIDEQVVKTPSGKSYSFDLPPRQKQMLLEGLDVIGLTLREAAAIEAFEQRHWTRSPWCRVDLARQRQSASMGAAKLE
ncbi:3-isopropylmalate dehydratase small subunit [Caballeronia sp. LZ035]|uniref:3-isopropylmalate dehydratase small subunit n=1 Tax=Caballeronia sp. LZ035 TaxID=3038568 RepID=UPI00285F5353|nr:3-isopropylmalate dehydratase small subunit [Caballeronia sp. LZ035]MDR5760599.1 3-isopropylmalate dehydratase small subunit [Caballeronia sp. LZ035]